MSSFDQNSGWHYETVGWFDKTFADKLSEKSPADRAGLNALIDDAHEGGHIRVASLDHLGRDTRDLYSLIDTLTGGGGSPVVID